MRRECLAFRILFCCGGGGACEQLWTAPMGISRQLRLQVQFYTKKGAGSLLYGFTLVRGSRRFHQPLSWCSVYHLQTVPRRFAGWSPTRNADYSGLSPRLLYSLCFFPNLKTPVQSGPSPLFNDAWGSPTRLCGRQKPLPTARPEQRPCGAARAARLRPA
jgi:hypothetical protein